MQKDKSKNSYNAADFSYSESFVFSRIAKKYDFLCDVFSIYIQRIWKAKIAKQISSETEGLLLDIASGTGDIPYRILNEGNGNHKNLRILVTDICPEMLEVAKSKIGNHDNVEYRIFNAHDIKELDDNSIDGFSISFGMKICDREKVLSEAYRVLKKGGKFYCLEASRIPNSFIYKCYMKYMGWCLPLIARIVVNGDKDAYNYLLHGIKDFSDQKNLCKEIADAGFKGVSYFGIVAIHRGVK